MKKRKNILEDLKKLPQEKADDLLEVLFEIVKLNKPIKKRK